MARQSNRVSVTNEQKEILLGILLGDGHLELAKGGKSARLHIEQELKNREYVEHLHQVFDNWFPGEIVPATNSNNLKFTAKFASTLLHYHRSFYCDKTPMISKPDKTKRDRKVPRWIEHCFTARSLAYLIMDDGGIKSKESKGMYINLYGMPRIEQEFLCKVLIRKFGLQGKVVRDRKYHTIYISGYRYKTLIDPYILNCTRYKIPPPRKERKKILS